MSKSHRAVAAIKEIDDFVQFWRADEVDGPTYTLLQVDQVLARYFGREIVNFPEDAPE